MLNYTQQYASFGTRSSKKKARTPNACAFYISTYEQGYFKALNSVFLGARHFLLGKGHLIQILMSMGSFQEALRQIPKTLRELPLLPPWSSWPVDVLMSMLSIDNNKLKKKTKIKMCHFYFCVQRDKVECQHSGIKQFQRYIFHFLLFLLIRCQICCVKTF